LFLHFIKRLSVLFYIFTNVFSQFSTNIQDSPPIRASLPWKTNKYYPLLGWKIELFCHLLPWKNEKLHLRWQVWSIL